MRNKADDKARGWSIGDDDVRVLELVTIPSRWAAFGLTRQREDSLACAHEAAQWSRQCRLMHISRPSNEESVPCAHSLVRVGLADDRLEVLDSLLRAGVAFVDNVPAVLVRLSAYLLSNDLEHLGCVSA